MFACVLCVCVCVLCVCVCVCCVCVCVCVCVGGSENGVLPLLRGSFSSPYSQKVISFRNISACDKIPGSLTVNALRA